MSRNNKRSIFIVFVILFFGCIIGTALGQFFAYILPEGIVSKFLLNEIPIGWGENPDQWVDLYVIKFKTGFYINVSVISLIGMMISWYFLRYFR